MSSENKKRKAKNSFLHNGGDKEDRLKRVMYYTKRQRNKIKSQCKEYE